MTQESGVSDNTVSAEQNIPSDGIEVSNSPSVLPEVKSEEPKVEEPKEPKSDEEKPKRPGRWERELAKRDAELEEMREKLNKLTTPDKSDKPDVEGPPEEKDYDNVLDFLKAERDYAINEALKNFQEDQSKKQTESQKQAAVNERIQAFERRELAIIEANPEYTEKLAELAEDGFITEDMINEIRESEVGEKISLHLTQNPDDAKLLSQLKGRQLTKVIGILEAKLSSTEKVAERQTKAAAPIQPVKAQSTSSKSPVDMEQNDYEKWRGFK